MRRATLLLAPAIAGIMLLPGIAAAQCEGGTSGAGYYLRSGAYVPGGCSYTNATTPGQLYPSGAQPQGSTNPALTGGLATSRPSAGPGVAPAGGTGVATLPPNTSTAMGPANTLAEQANPLRPQPAVSEVAGGATTATTATSGAGTATTPSRLPGPGSPGRLANPSAASPTGVASTGTANSGAASGPTGSTPASQLGPTTGTGQSAYGYSLPAARPADVGTESPSDSGPEAPPAPGRGGATVVGGERATGTVISLPER